MKLLDIVLAGNPRGKGRPRFRVIESARGSFGSAYTDSKTRKYEAALQMEAVKAMAGRLPFDEPLSVAVEAHMPVPESWSRLKRARAIAGELMPTGRPDADNLIKTIDAFNGIVWRDDSLIVRLEFLKSYSSEPRLLVSVYRWND